MKGLNKVKRKLNEYPNIINVNDMQEYGKIVISDITQHIRNQIEITDKKELKRNAPSTIKRKGHSKSLIDKGLLVSKSTYSMNAQQHNVKITLKSIRRDIGQYVQEKGYYFWGISPAGRRVILKRYLKKVAEWLTK